MQNSKRFDQSMYMNTKAEKGCLRIRPVMLQVLP